MTAPIDTAELRLKADDALANLVAAETHGMLNYIDWMIVGVRDMDSLLDELDELRAENERLTKYEGAWAICKENLEADNERLEIEIDLYRVEVQRYEGTVGRLRAAAQALLDDYPKPGDPAYGYALRQLREALAAPEKPCPIKGNCDQADEERGPMTDTQPDPNTGIDTLCERLEAHEGEQFETTMCFNGVRREAAARIRDLTAERDKYREALAAIVKFGEDNCNSETMYDSLLVARAALEGSKS